MSKKKIEQKTYEGEIKITQKGSGYVSVNGIKNDIEIKEENLNSAFNKDTVLISLSEDKNSGRVLNILKRYKKKFVGILKYDNGTYTVLPDDSKMYRDFLLESKNIKKENIGKKILIEFTEWRHGDKNPMAEIREILGDVGNNDVEMRAILLGKEIDIDFPKNVQEEASKIQREIREEEIKKRKDMRNVPTITIDPKNAKDFDDALSVRKLENGNYEIGIHIADVTYFVHPKGEIDKEAVKRGTSIYLVDRTIPMLPEILSNDVCSLNEKEDKLTFSAIFTLDDNANIKSQWFGRTVIHSDKRFSYEEAQEIIDRKNGPFSNELLILDSLSKILRKKKFDKGAIDFEDSEVVIEIDKDGVPISIYKKERLHTHKLIEEFMLLANKKVALCVSELIKKSGIRKPFVYRVHESPDQNKINQLISILSSLGYKVVKKDGKITGEILNKILKKSHGKPEESLVQQAAIKAMSKAVYSIKNIGHFGLAFSHYTHFTSPIRRYPDMIVHRLLAIYLLGKTVDKDDIEKYDRLATHSSERERLAEEAERDSIKLKQAEYMEKKIGVKWSGVISGVTKWGIYIQDLKTKSEGLIRINDLGSEYFVFNEDKMALIGERSKKKYRLGDKINVRVTSVDTKKRQINLSLL